MNTLLLLNGNSEKILRANGLAAGETRIIKIEEKDLSKPKKILRAILSDRRANIYFGCIDLDYIRFQTFMKFYIFMGSGRGSIIDESGKRNQFSRARFFFVDIPKLELEAITSLIIIPYYYIKFYIIRWKYLKRA
ncbi:MAG: hypothetical protein ACM3U1_03190 [Chloroflexota bacterium]